MNTKMEKNLIGLLEILASINNAWLSFWKERQCLCLKRQYLPLAGLLVTFSNAAPSFLACSDLSSVGFTKIFGVYKDLWGRTLAGCFAHDSWSSDDVEVLLPHGWLCLWWRHAEYVAFWSRRCKHAEYVAFWSRYRHAEYVAFSSRYSWTIATPLAYIIVYCLGFPCICIHALLLCYNCLVP